MTFRQHVLTEPARDLRRPASLVRGLCDREPAFPIEPVAPARVRLVQRERLTGVLVQLFRKGLAATRLGVERMNLAPETPAEGAAAS